MTTSARNRAVQPWGPLDADQTAKIDGWAHLPELTGKTVVTTTETAAPERLRFSTALDDELQGGPMSRSARQTELVVSRKWRPAGPSVVERLALVLTSATPDDPQDSSRLAASELAV